MQGARLPSLVRELRSCVPHGLAKKTKAKTKTYSNHEQLEKQNAKNKNIDNSIQKLKYLIKDGSNERCVRPLHRKL